MLPFAVLPAGFLFFITGRELKLPWHGPSCLLLIYGTVAAFASVFNPEPLWSLYWSMTFLATIFAAWSFLDRRNPVGSTRQLLSVTWVATLIVAAIIGYQAQNSIFGQASSGYGAIGELKGLSRSSGVARWAAVPGLVCLIRAYYSRRVLHIPIYLGIASIAFFIVYRMQSRGAVFGVVGALLFALFVGSRLRRYALPFMLIVVALLLLLDSPGTVSNRVTEYLERGQSKEQFLSMTGRTRAYRVGLASFAEAPILGRGQWADRLTIGEHVHNSYLQALMNAGIVGGIPYFASWISGWVLFFRLQKRLNRLLPDDHVYLLEAGTVMMFFTIRSIPETTTASFAVDLLVMVAIYVYLETLEIATKRKVPGHLQPIMLPSPAWLSGVRRRNAG